MTNTELLHEMIAGLVRDAMRGTELFPRMVELTHVSGKYSKLGSMCGDELYEGIAACVASGKIIEIVYSLHGSDEQKRVYLPGRAQVKAPCPALGD